MRRALCLAVCSLFLLTGCPEKKHVGSTRVGDSVLTVLAASSLTDAFTSIGKDFEAHHPGVHVRFSFGPSDGLAGQIRQGAPADVFASASSRWMEAVAGDPGVVDRRVFARNRLTVILPRDDPAGIASIRDLAKPGVKLVLAAEGVPAGDYGRQALDNAGIADLGRRNVVSNAVDVKGVVQTVVSGDADAGIVYVTDVTPDVRSQVQVVAIPDRLNVIARYSIAVLRDTTDRGQADLFVDYVEGPGQVALRAAGFIPPG